MHVSVFLATYFETNGHFDSNVKLFPIIYVNYRPMTDDRRQTETLHNSYYISPICIYLYIIINALNEAEDI
jgi:hypothetical protein